MAESSESEVQANGGISSQEDSVDDVWIENNPEEEHEFSSTVNVRGKTCVCRFVRLSVIQTVCSMRL